MLSKMIEINEMIKSVWIFTSLTCAPCKLLKKELERLPEILASIKMVCLDDGVEKISEDGFFCAEYMPKYLPAVYFMINDMPHESHEGYSPGLVSKIQEFLGE